MRSASYLDTTSGRISIFSILISSSPGNWKYFTSCWMQRETRQSMKRREIHNKEEMKVLQHIAEHLGTVMLFNTMKMSLMGTSSRWRQRECFCIALLCYTTRTILTSKFLKKRSLFLNSLVFICNKKDSKGGNVFLKSGFCMPHQPLQAPDALASEKLQSRNQQSDCSRTTNQHAAGSHSTLWSDLIETTDL